MIFGVALEVLRKQSNCWDKITECSANCEECECHADASDLVEAVKTVLDAFSGSGDTISRQAAIDALLRQTYQDGAYGYTDAKSIVDTLNALPSIQAEPATSTNDGAIDLIDRAEAQTELQFVAKRYTVSNESNGEGHVVWVVWSDILISITDAMNALRKVPSITEKRMKQI